MGPWSGGSTKPKRYADCLQLYIKGGHKNQMGLHVTTY